MRIIDIIFNYMMNYEPQNKSPFREWVKLYQETMNASLRAVAVAFPDQLWESGGEDFKVVDKMVW